MTRDAGGLGVTQEATNFSSGSSFHGNWEASVFPLCSPPRGLQPRSSVSALAQQAWCHIPLWAFAHLAMCLAPFRWILIKHDSCVHCNHGNLQLSYARRSWQKGQIALGYFQAIEAEQIEDRESQTTFAESILVFGGNWKHQVIHIFDHSLHLSVCSIGFMKPAVMLGAKTGSEVLQSCFFVYLEPVAALNPNSHVSGSSCFAIYFCAWILLMALL